MEISKSSDLHLEGAYNHQLRRSAIYTLSFLSCPLFSPQIHVTEAHVDCSQSLLNYLPLFSLLPMVFMLLVLIFIMHSSTHVPPHNLFKNLQQLLTGTLNKGQSCLATKTLLDLLATDQDYQPQQTLQLSPRRSFLPGTSSQKGAFPPIISVILY